MLRMPSKFRSLEGLGASSRRLTLAAASVTMLLCVATMARAQEPTLSGPAYAAANEAYTAFKNADYPLATAKTRAAINLRPDSVQLRLLLVDVLFAAGNFDEADAVANDALTRFGSNADLIGRQNNIRERLAYKTKAESYELADKAFKEFAQQDYAAAADHARRAVELDPTNRGYRLLLINATIAAKNLDEADQLVTASIQVIGKDPELLNRQQFIHERIAARPAVEAYQSADAAYKAFAQKDYTTALAEARKAVELDPTNRSYRELVENIQRAAKAPATVVQSKGALRAQRGYNNQRRGDYAAAAADFESALRSGLQSRSQSRNVRLALVDSSLAAQDPERALSVLADFRDSESYEVAIRRAYALQALKRSEVAAEAFAIAGRNARNPRERATALSAELSLLAQAGHKIEARQRFDAALANGELVALSAADTANLALIVGNDYVAAGYYQQMRESGHLRGRALLDAGYIATRVYRTQDAIGYFEGAIDAYHAGQLDLDPQQLFNVRRQVAEMSRTWGVYSSITYSKSGAGPGFGFIPPTSPGSTAQAGTELYWRPFGYQNGSVFDVFIRGFETLYAQNGPTGSKTLQGMYGARWKPFGQANLILEAAQVFSIGSLSRNDWLLRAGYSTGQGTDLRVDTNNWATWQVYADYNHFIENSQNIANFDLRMGWSYRLDAIHSNLVLFPHVGFFVNYDNKLGNQSAYSAGPGVTLRYWFREDKYTAPMSYVDLTAQYRFRIAGDERAEGVFAQVLISY
jgi:Flp pilus assembly protein TadD